MDIVTLALGRWRQENEKFKVILISVVTLRPARLHETLSQKVGGEECRKSGKVKHFFEIVSLLIQLVSKRKTCSILQVRGHSAPLLTPHLPHEVKSHLPREF